MRLAVTTVQRAQIEFEHSEPILRVEDMKASVAYYVEVLGFRNSDWGSDDFTYVSRGHAGIYLCRGGQGRGAAWAWIGVEDVAKLFDEYKATGARIRLEPTNLPWALEMQIEDLDGNVLRFGSDPAQ